MRRRFIQTPKTGISRNEIWYTSTDGNVVILYYTNAFGVNIVSNTYDAAKECWVIKFDGKVTMIGDDAFNSRSSLISVTIPDSVTTIGNRAFSGCNSLTSITIPEGVTSIGDGTFFGCSSLTSITIPESVTAIGENAFWYCESLTSVIIGDSVTTIENWAFRYCSSLTNVYCKAITPPAGGIYMFSGNASGRKIYVPTESVEAYKSAKYWSEYASDIVGYNF